MSLSFVKFPEASHLIHKRAGKSSALCLRLSASLKALADGLFHWDVPDVAVRSHRGSVIPQTPIFLCGSPAELSLLCACHAHLLCLFVANVPLYHGIWVDEPPYLCPVPLLTAGPGSAWCRAAIGKCLLNIERMGWETNRLGSVLRDHG